MFKNCMIYKHLLVTSGFIALFLNASLWIKYVKLFKKKNILSTNDIIDEEYLVMVGKNMESLLANDTRVIKFIQEKVLNSPSDHPYNFGKSKAYSDMSKGLSHTPIQDYLKKLFVDEPPGFFVEAGALDGQFLSNTLWLEKVKLWKGLLVEPDPSSYSALKEKNRKAWSANACLSTFQHPVNVSLTGYTFRIINDLYEQDYRWIYKGHTHTLRNDDYEELKDYSLPVEKSFYTSQCFPLESFLLALNVSVVDFLSLDIQGGEWEVLKLFPWDRMYIRTLAVEYYELNQPTGTLSPSFIRFMAEKGFQLVGTMTEPDYIFVHKKETKLLNKMDTENIHL